MCAQLTDLLFIAELVKQIPSLSLINNPYFIFMANLLDLFFLYPWGNGLCRELIASIINWANCYSTGWLVLAKLSDRGKDLNLMGDSDTKPLTKPRE